MAHSTLPTFPPIPPFPPMAPSLLSVVVPVHDRADLLRRCLESLDGWTVPREIIVVDDGSRDPGVDRLREERPDLVWIHVAENRGFSAAVNRGLGETRGDTLLLLNSDAEVRRGGDTALASAFAARPRPGAVAARLFHPDGRPQWSGGDEPTLVWLFALASGLARGARRSSASFRQAPSGWRGGDVEWAPAAALALSRAAWVATGPFDESFRHYAQDLDYAHRLRRAGFRIRVEPGLEVVHHLGGSAGDGALQGQRLDWLWCDLVRWIAKARGERAARAAARVLRFGGRWRLRRLRARGDAREAASVREAIAAVSSGASSLL